MTNKAAQSLSRLRWDKMNKEERSAHGKNAAASRWSARSPEEKELFMANMRAKRAISPKSAIPKIKTVHSK